jgi:aminoacyl-tRNA hydrolase
MFTIVGLGNPGAEYEKTRHNTGRILVSLMPDSRAYKKIIPDTFMNRSGKAVAPYIKSVKAAKSLIVVHDDLDLPLGVVRVSFGSSAAGHNGVKSVQTAVKTKDFIRIRVGVSKASRGKAKKPVGEKAVLDFLLGKMTKKEYDLLTGPITERVRVALEAIMKEGDPVAGMNAVNGLEPQK